MYQEELTEGHLDKMYDDLGKEQRRLMESLKTTKEQNKEQDITKQITILNSLIMTIMRLRCLKRKIALKINC